MSEQTKSLPVPSVRARVKADCEELEALLDEMFGRVKYYEHPPLRVGSVCWG